MVKWQGGALRNHVYVPDAAHLADKVYEEFQKVLSERGSVLTAKPYKISKGIFQRKERPALSVRFSEGGDVYAVVTAMAVGPDLYVGYAIVGLKKELDEIEAQDMEAFSRHLENALKITLQRLGIVLE